MGVDGEIFRAPEFALNFSKASAAWFIDAQS